MTPSWRRCSRPPPVSMHRIAIMNTDLASGVRCGSSLVGGAPVAKTNLWDGQDTRSQRVDRRLVLRGVLFGAGGVGVAGVVGCGGGGNGGAGTTSAGSPAATGTAAASAAAEQPSAGGE